MIRPLSLALVAGALLAAPSYSALADEGVTLRFRPLDAPLVLEQRVRKQRDGLLGDTVVPQEQDDVLDRLTRTQDDAGGALQVRVKQVSRRVKLDGDEVTATYRTYTDPAADIVFRTDALGRILEEKAGAAPRDELVLPPGVVAPGDTWKGELPPAEGRPFAVPLTFRLERLEGVGAAQRAFITVKSTGKRTVAALAGKVRWRIQGAFVFDVAGGFVREQRGEQSYEVRYPSSPDGSRMAYRTTERHELHAVGDGR